MKTSIYEDVDLKEPIGTYKGFFVFINVRSKKFIFSASGINKGSESVYIKAKNLPELEAKIDEVIK